MNRTSLSWDENSEINIPSQIMHIQERTYTKNHDKNYSRPFLTRSVGHNDVVPKTAQSPRQIDTKHHYVVQGIIGVFRVVVEVHDDEQDVEDQSHSPPRECTRVSVVSFTHCERI